MELLREVLLYCIEANHMKSVDLASVCRHWRSIITSIASLWSTLKFGIWTEMERVETWLQRAYPMKVVIDCQRDREIIFELSPFSALQDALSSTSQWHELSIFSFPRGSSASRLGLQIASPMHVLKVLHVAAGCVDSPSFSHLLNLVPTQGPLTELRLHSSVASAHFLQRHWFSVLRNLTVLIVSGKDINEPFDLLSTFTQLQIFEADRLPLPFYEPNTNLPFLSTLRKLQLRACSIQWMAGRRFPCLEECAILLPRHWATIQHHEVQFPSCKKLTYHGHPMTAAQYFDVPEMRAMELRSHDCNEQRVYQHLRRLCEVDGRISKLSTLHLTVQCSEQVLIKVLTYLVPLQELVLSITHPSPSWQHFLDSLAAKPSTQDWPVWRPGWDRRREWNRWCSSQTWRANVLPHLRYLGLQCPKGFSQSECLETCPILRLVGWTRAQLTPPLEHLKVWEGRGTTDDIVVDYISTDYMVKHYRILKRYDAFVVRGMVTRCLAIDQNNTILLQLRSSALFRLLEDLKISINDYDNCIDYGPVFSILEKLKRLEILDIDTSADPSESASPFMNTLQSDSPLMDTLQWLKLPYSAFFWMLERTFKALREFEVQGSDRRESLSRHEGQQVCLPACTILKLKNYAEDNLRFLSCPNVQVFHFGRMLYGISISEAVLKCLYDFLRNCRHLQELELDIRDHLECIDPLMQFVFVDAREQGIWQDIRSVEMKVEFPGPGGGANRFLKRTVEHERDYENWWEEFTVTTQDFVTVKVKAST